MVEPRTPKVERPKAPKKETETIRAKDLPEILTEEEFLAYLSIKQEEKPGDPFFADAEKVRDWLLIRHHKRVR